MTVRRRIISAIVVFGVGFAAALPFLKEPAPEETPATNIPDVTPKAPPPSVALRIPVEEPALPKATAPKPSPAASRPSIESRPIASEALLKAEPRLPTISSEFPSGNPIVPPIARSMEPTSRNATGPGEDLTKSGPRMYKIRDGDTLRRIAQRYLDNSERWREIFELNQPLIVDPELLPIGKEILLPDRGNMASPPRSANSQALSSTPEPPLTTLVPIQ